ncbi:MAG: PEP-CTERM sorting domain-containing protein [Opitutales bacterium]|nr:PEP-CTERM sorting domain-containing protein [Opitutales bacterium]
MKLKTAITLFALFGGTTGTMAGILDKFGGGGSSFDLDGYTYKKTGNNIYITSAFPSKGSNLGIGNYGMSYNISTDEDARHEIIVRFTTSEGGIGNSNQPILNFYLDGNGKSLLLGNYYSTSGDFGVARMTLFNGDASTGSQRGGSPTFILNNKYSSTAGANYQTPVSGQHWTATGSGDLKTKIKDGSHCYKIVVETYKGNTNDKIALYYEGPNGNAKTNEIALSTLGITSFDSIGYFLAGEGGSVVLDGAGTTSGIYKYSRVVTPGTEPEPELPTEPVIPPGDPSVPEPSAFGLLAGLGAIALAVSRRRRSR